MPRSWRVVGCVSLLGFAACTSPAPGSVFRECLPGPVVSCACPDGDGARACDADGRFEACDCSGSVAGAVPDPTGEADYLIDFGAVALGERPRAALPLRNLGMGPLRFEVEPIAAPFALDGPGTVVVDPGTSGELGVSFRPTSPGPASAVVRVTSGGASFTVRLAGEGFEARLDCEPLAIDFGPGVLGQTRTREVVCANGATHSWALSAGPITGADAAEFGVTSVPAQRLPPGGRWHLLVTTTPLRLGSFEAVLPLTTAGGAAAATIQLSATAIQHALDCGPTAIDFGFVAPGTTSHGAFRCTNVGADPVRIDATLDPSSQDRFSWTPSTPAEVPGLEGGVPGSLTIDLEFSPLAEDAGSRKNGILLVSTDDPSLPRIDVPMTGFAGGPVLSCSPASLDFGDVASGLPVTRSITCANVGTDDPARLDDLLVIDGVASTDPTEFRAVTRGGLAESYAVGETFTVDVTYAPTDDGPDVEALRFLSNDTRSSPDAPYAVPVTGAGRVLPPCDVELAPAELRFGVVEAGASATLEFAIRNRRPDAPCLYRDLRLAPDCAPEFSVPADEFARGAVPPGGELRVPVRFAPTYHHGVPFTCAVLFDVAHPVEPHRVVPVSGMAWPSCGLVTGEVEFGLSRPGCATRDHAVEVFNTCSVPLTIDAVDLGEGSSDEFFLRSVPPAGTTVESLHAVTLTAAYRPEDEGSDVGALFVQVDGDPAPLLVTLRGRAALDGLQTDRFVQEVRKVDVLWVIDNGLSMGPKQAALAASVGSFLARASGADFHVGVTSAGLSPVVPPIPPNICPGGAYGGESGRLFPVDHSRPRVLDASTPDLQATLAANVAVGACSYDRDVLDAATRALVPPLVDNCDDPRHPEANDGNCGFLRDDANLAIIAVTDAAYGSATAAYYADGLRSLKGFRPGDRDRVQLHAITGDRGTGCGPLPGGAAPGDALIDWAASSAGGTFHSICTTNWAGAMHDLGEAVFAPRSCFELTEAPEEIDGDMPPSLDGGDFFVHVDGVDVSSQTAEGNAVWAYRSDLRAICFDPLFVPGPGAPIDVSYRVACLAL